MTREKLVALIAAGAGIIAGNTLLDFTNDLPGLIWNRGSQAPSVTFTCTPQ